MLIVGVDTLLVEVDALLVGVNTILDQIREIKNLQKSQLVMNRAHLMYETLTTSVSARY